MNAAKKPPNAFGPGDLFDSTEAPRAMLVVERGHFAGKVLRLVGETATIGRSSKCDLSLKGAAGVSRTHCSVVFEDERYFIDDMGSRNGTMVNKVEVRGRAVLADGDLIEVGDEGMRFAFADSDSTDALAKRETFVLDPAGRPPVDRSPVPRSARSGSDVVDSEKLVRAPRMQLGSDEYSLASSAAGADDTPVYIPSSEHTDAPVRDMSSDMDRDTPDPFASDMPPLGMGPATAPGTSNFLVSHDVTNSATAHAITQDEPLPVLDLKSSPPNAQSAGGMPILEPAEPTSGALRSLLAGLMLGLIVAAVLIGVWDHFMNEGDLRADVLFAMRSGSDDDDNDDDTQAQPLAGAAAVAAAGADAGDASSNTVVPDTVEARVDAGRSSEQKVVAQAADTAPSAAAESPDANAPAEDAQPVAVPFSGRITSVLVKVGDEVTAGQRLLRIDVSSGSTKRKLRSLKGEERALKKAAAQGRAQAKKDLKKVRAELRKILSASRPLSLKAPSGGKITAVQVRSGQSVSKGHIALSLAP